jgi:hypothetical protein
MKTPSDELFTLIKSLNRYEKRHFKTASRHGRGGAGESAAYLALFDAIDSMDHYNEKDLHTILKKSGGPEKLKRIKSYLQESILRFLEDYYVDYSVEIQMQRYLQRIEVLLEKRLYDMAWKVMGKVEKYARDNESFNYLLIILDWKRKAMLRQANLERISEYLKEGFDEEMRVVDAYRNLIEYRKLNLQSDAILKTVFEGADEKNIVKLKEILKNHFLQNVRYAESDRARGLFYAILGNIYVYFPEHWEKSNSCYRKAIEIQEKSILFQNESARAYLGLLSGLCTTEILLKKTEELQSTVEKAGVFFNSQTQKIQTGNLLNQYMGILINYISYAVEQFNIDRARVQSEKVKDYIDNFGDEVIYLVFYANYAIISFFLKDFHLALRCINNILEREKTLIRQDIINDFRIYNLMVHYELSNEDILPNLVKSTKNRLSKGRELNPAEILLLDLFGKILPRIPLGQEKREVFRKASEEFGKFISTQKAPYTQRHDSFVLEWLESKAENVSFLEWSRKKSAATH